MVSAVKIASVLIYTLFLMCFLSCLSNLILAEPQNAALTIVQTEETENGEVTVEVNGDDNTNEEEEEEEDGSSEPFIPTDEWQTVKKGQSVPAGLHIRMNLAEGGKEAKLISDDTDKQQQAWQPGQGLGTLKTDKKQFSRDELKQALKDFKTTKIDEFDKEKADDIKSQFKSYEELKEDFRQLNMNIETDAEIVTKLVRKLKGTTDKETLLTVLTDLEYYLHQIDNGVLFKGLEGIPILLKLMNSSSEVSIQQAATVTLGAALQSNPKAKIGAIEAGTLQLLLRMMATKQPVELLRKLMFAISALLRHFPFAQKTFLELGGLGTFSELFNQPGMEPVCIKSIALLNDILMEQDYVLQHTDIEDKNQLDKLRQYEKIQLRQAMHAQGWCDLIPRLLDLQEHDSREKVIGAMKTLNSDCSTEFKMAASKLARLRKEYSVLAKEEDNDSDKYFTSLLESVNNLMEHLHVSREEL